MRGASTWSRWDKDRTTSGAWLAFTTDPIRSDLVWIVDSTPTTAGLSSWPRGRRLLPAQQLVGARLLFRQGGYGWDGTV
ncbi:hypothetical protein [Streptomyces sp. NBC_01497]|uniref:hypothetical protein n=1 Tax=Streptomyces sp. NBC_01497 TaxID=2903885 RepID=UPI002E304445|nr:hypothetical protein [Streptomyces sp. NBC_01497]